MSCALVTGASRGIGRAIALQLSRDLEIHVLVNYSNDDAAAQDTIEAIVREGGSGELLKFPVQDKNACHEAITRWQKRNPGRHISVLVNNAGIALDGLMMWMPDENWENVIDISLNGFFYTTKHVLHGMLLRKYGRIINIASISGLRGAPGQTNYSAAKAGLVGATKALAQEVARMNITVNAVAPGFINTSMINDIDMQKYLKLIPAGRVGEPEEVAHVVSFLASDKATYVTGEVINVNGGLYS